ncbi:ABC transporter permease, partial [Streptomyces sp. SID14478]|nr:ABC transporter permease [Streptomyces sp. SID14478]
MAAATKAVAPWVRTRLRTAPGAAAALFLLVLLTSCLAAAFPRAVDRYEDKGLRQAVADEAPSRMILNITASDSDAGLPPEFQGEKPTARAIGAAYRKITASLKEPFVADPRESSYGARSPEGMASPEDWLPQPDGLPPEFTMYAQNGLAAHTEVTAGRLPGADFTADRIEAAVTRDTARRMHLKVGSVLHVPGADARPIAVHITGVVVPRDASGAYWSATPLLRTAALRSTDAIPPSHFWAAGLLLHPDAAPALVNTSGQAEQYWQIAPDTSAFTARRIPALKAGLAYTMNGPGLPAVRKATGSTTTDVSSGLTDVIARFEELRSGITPVVAVAAYGTGTVACIVLLMAGGLAADRRRAELALLRSRGGSLRGIGGR